MMAIGKYTDDKSLFHYIDPTGERDPNPYIDKILIEKMGVEDFPVFDIGTDSTEEDISKKAISEFALRFSMRMDYTSANGDSIKDFFSEGGCKFAIFLSTDYMDLTGYSTSDKVTIDETYHEGKYHVSFLCRGLEEEFKTGLEEETSEFSGITSNTSISFESFMLLYPLDNFNVELPPELFVSKVGNANIRFRGAKYRRVGVANYTNWNTVSRWQTFYDLKRGLGFDFEILPNDSIENIYAGLGNQNGMRNVTKIKIFFPEDIENEDPITLTRTTKNITEITAKNAYSHIFMGWSESVYTTTDGFGQHGALTVMIIADSMTGIRGILMDKDGFYKYADNGDGAIDGEDGFKCLFPFFMRSHGNFVKYPASLAEQNYYLYCEFYSGLLPEGTSSFPLDNAYHQNDIYRIPLTHYSAPNNWNHPIGIKAGAVTFPAFFQDNDGYYHDVMKFAIRNYIRFLSGSEGKKKKVRSKLSDVPGIKPYKHIIIGDESYFVSRITGLDLPNRRIEYELTKISDILFS